MKTMVTEEQIKNLKYRGICASNYMKNHMVTWHSNDGDFENVISRMHNAPNKDKLSEAYYAYINLCTTNYYSDDEIIGGIMQNDDKNKEFNVDIDSVIRSIIEIRSGKIDLGKTDCENSQQHAESPDAKPVENKTPDNESAGGVKVSNKAINKINNKVKYVNGILDNLINNKSENIYNDITKIKSICAETRQRILSIDPTSCSDEEITELNDANANIDSFIKSIEKFETNNNTPMKTQGVAAHTEGMFNINNFIKQPLANTTIQPVTHNQSKPKPCVFPHQICGLTDEEIVNYVGKHFKVIEELSACPLYDLVNNKLLSKKMKEFNSKQRANNPYLTQVNINEYIDDPDLLQTYSLCFTIPCNDKGKVIVVLFNPVPVPNKNGMLNYPLHIFKATMTKKNGSK